MTESLTRPPYSLISLLACKMGLPHFFFSLVLDPFGHPYFHRDRRSVVMLAVSQLSLSSSGHRAPIEPLLLVVILSYYHHQVIVPTRSR